MTERRRLLEEWLAAHRRYATYGKVGDVTDDKERKEVADWLDKEIGAFLEWQMMRKDSKVILERTDYVNEHFTTDGLEPRLERAVLERNNGRGRLVREYGPLEMVGSWPPPAKGTHVSQIDPDMDLTIDDDPVNGVYDDLPAYDRAAEWSRS